MFGSAAKEYLRVLLTSHLDRTGSERAAAALRDLDEFVRRLWVVVPASEKGNPLLASQVGRCLSMYVCMYVCVKTSAVPAISYVYFVCMYVCL